MNFDDIEIRTIEKLDLKNGDVLAVYTRRYIPSEVKEKIITQMMHALDPIKIKVIVIDGDEIKLQALRAEEENVRQNS